MAASGKIPPLCMLRPLGTRLRVARLLVFRGPTRLRRARLPIGMMTEMTIKALPPPFYVVRVSCKDVSTSPVLAVLGR